MQRAMEIFGVGADASVQWVVVFAIVFATLVLRYVAKLVFDRLAKQLERTKNLYDDALLDAARKPIGWGIWSMGILFAAEYALRGAGSDLVAYVDPVRDVIAIVLLAWFAIRLIHFVEEHVTDPEYRTDPVDKTTATAIGKLLRASVLITALLMALASLGFSVTGVLAFGGLGGLAVGFAARDLLANFFGALMIFLDRPFAGGATGSGLPTRTSKARWRRSAGVRPGSAHSISDRCTCPNSTFATLTVENPQRMLNRRIYEIVGIRYDDVGVLKAVIDDIRDMLVNHEAIDPRDRTLMVNLLEFRPVESLGRHDLHLHLKTHASGPSSTPSRRTYCSGLAAIVEGHGAPRWRNFWSHPDRACRLCARIPSRSSRCRARCQ